MKANARDLWLQEVSVSALKILAQGMLDDLNEAEKEYSEPREVASAFLYLYKLIKEEEFLEKIPNIEH
jgi:hypothetical protein